MFTVQKTHCHSIVIHSHTQSYIVIHSHTIVSICNTVRKQLCDHCINYCVTIVIIVHCSLFKKVQKCSLFYVHCSLPTAYCLLPTVHCSKKFIVHCSKNVHCSMFKKFKKVQKSFQFRVYSSLLTAYYLLHTVHCSLFAGFSSILSSQSFINLVFPILSILSFQSFQSCLPNTFNLVFPIFHQSCLLLQLSIKNLLCFRLFWYLVVVSL